MVGAVDDSADLGVVVEEGRELSPGVLPELADRWVAVGPLVEELRQPFLGVGLVDRGVDRANVCRRKRRSHIRDTAVLQLGEDSEPELGALGARAGPDAEDVALAFDGDTDGAVKRGLLTWMWVRRRPDGCGARVGVGVMGPAASMTRARAAWAEWKP